LILAFILSFIYSNRDKPAVSWPLALIAGGAVGNVIDRIRTGRVVDFLDFDFFDFQLFGNKIERWWTFNIADAAITVGIITLVFWILFSAGSKNETEAGDKEPLTDS
jgi:signal peptidase II